MSFLTLLRISRPRFRHYVLWPMLIYFAGSWFLQQIQDSFVRWWTDWIFYMLVMIIILWYFTLPANLWIYGWNDIADGDTDKFNTKKWSYEAKIEDSVVMKRKLEWRIWVWNIGYIIIGTSLISFLMMISDCFPLWSNGYMCNGLFSLQWLYALFLICLLSIGRVLIILSIFLITSYLYSCWPLRAKAKPFIDGIMNVLYIITPFVVIYWADRNLNYMMFSLRHALPNLFAALFRCMAMHCYSAIPDIEPDRKAWLTTTAVYLGKQKSLIYCGILYLLSALLSFHTLWWFSIVWWIIYISVMMISYSKKDIFWLYTIFPYINLVIGFSLFWYIILMS